MDSVSNDLKEQLTIREGFSQLIIENDLPTIKGLTRFFSSRGFSCNRIYSGVKGLEEMDKSIPKKVLLNYILPNINGYEIYR